jgi:tetratricopeptide (TPR) repeat protein
MSALEPLPADPKRQADAMLRGCDYQVWQTVSAWLDLRGSEVLYVEGAEDFDCVADDSAEAVQVKASARPISLGQATVHEALNNFWVLRGKSQSVKLKFRFLTRAPCTIEQERPFGEGVAGLELWNRRSHSDEEVRALTNYLCGQERLLPELKLWLQHATPDDIRDQLIRAVVWETHAPDTAFIERNVDGKLLTFAEATGYPVPPATKIKQVAQTLVAEIWRVLRQPAPRRLDRLRLLELWDEATRVSIPQAELDARIRTASASLPATAPPELFRHGAPPLPGVVAPRLALVSTLRILLTTAGLLNLHGSARTGKTTLAKLIVGASEYEWLWWSAGRKSPSDVERELQLLVREATREPAINRFVLDDLDFSPSSTRIIEDSLGELISIAFGRHGEVIITSQKPLPQRLRNAFAVTEKQVISVPRLEAAELEEFALALGCPADRRRTIWARLVHVMTGGHPQLAAVHLFALRDRGWPEVTNEAISLGSTAIDAERTDARQLLAELPESQRLLLYRLSVFPLSFRKDHGVSMGGVPPLLTAPGEVMDSLTGPWIEPLHSGYFSVSPLISGAAQAVLEESQLVALQTAAADVLIKNEPRTTHEGAMAFQLVWETKDEGRLIALVQNWFGASDEIFGALSSELFWFIFIATEPGEQLFPDNPAVSMGLRPLQFRLALSTPIQARNVVIAWLAECPSVASGGEPLARLMLAGYVLPYHQVPLPPDIVVTLLGEVASALRLHPDLPVPTVSETTFPELDYVPPQEDLVSTLAFFSSQRCRDVGFLAGFLDALESIESDLRERILRGFVGGGLGARLAIDRVWLAEADKESPEWPQCIAALERAFRLASQWRSSEFATAAVRGIVIVLDEYLHDHAGAHAALDRLAKEGNVAPYHLLDRRASVYFSEGNYKEAEAQWRLALDLVPTASASFDLGPAFATRSAGIAAAKQGHWEVAAKWFLEIPRHLSADDTAFLAGAYADAGFAWWKAGREQDAVNCLIDAWQHAEALPTGKNDLRAFQTRKSVGHIITWVHSTATKEGAGDFAEPVPGMCTSGEERERLRELPETEGPAVWYLLMRIERELGTGDRAAQLGEAHVRSTSNPMIQSVAGMDRIREAVRSGRVTNLPYEAISVLRAMREAAAQVSASGVRLHAANRDPQAFERTDALGVLLFIAAIISGAAHGVSWQQTLDEWRTSLASTPHNADWDDWLSELNSALSASSGELSATVRRETEWSRNVVASTAIILSSQASAEDIFVAQARLLNVVPSSPWLREAADSFCVIIEGQWRGILGTPALIRSPALNGPAITAACADGNPSLEKAIRILEAAAPAVTATLSDAMWTAIRSSRGDAK